MVTHDPQEAMRLSDKILVIMNGKVIDEGSPEKLYSNPITPFSARISGPAGIIKSKSIQGIIHTPFGKINKFSNIMDGKDYEIFIRPEAFSISYNLDKGINVKIKALKNLGGIYQLSLLIDDKDKVENTSDSLHFFLPVRATPMESPPITKGQYRIQCPILLLYFAS